MVPIVNEDNEIIGFKNRSEINYQIDIIRSSSIWIKNPQNQILLARRALDKKIDPGKWGEAVGGTVEGHDNYIETALREAYEELGLTISEQDIEEGPLQYIDLNYKCFTQWYLLTLKRPVDSLKLQESEVIELKWFDENRLQTDLRNNPSNFITMLPDSLKLLAKPLQ